ncbi:tyrosyl-DNA phosphodiesterase 2 isoform X3 [Rhincodon typus]|uniref:tyrosyl-DNA phosphodiesterase 2 isoform X3 n=1 Tax=Rhincodon typus TaxID=259920 RepID=UPI002030FF1F|nr:tyrosyl-DNA phosphodiesterase 2 isoform X3 [Rhincodon typus]
MKGYRPERWAKKSPAKYHLLSSADEWALLHIEHHMEEQLKMRALNSYFETGVQPSSSAMESTSQLIERTDFQGCIDLTDTDNEQTSKGNTEQPQVDESQILLLTWNIDGLDLANLQERARGVCACLALYSPDIVFLQEVIQPYYLYLKKRAVSYTIIPGDEDDYFTAIMLKKSRVKLLEQEITPFPTTSMKRNLLAVQVNIAGNELCLMTSHLESTKAHSQERVKQLEIVLKKIKEAPENVTVIFGGDTNLRDQEVTKVGGLPEGVLDVWEFLNKPEHCRYTWDTKTNNNLKAQYTCRLRFDRVFYRAASEGQIVPQQMTLVGQDKLDCGRFCSDHWGLLCDFDVIL